MKTLFVSLLLILGITATSRAASIMYTYQSPTAVQADLATFKSMNIDVVMNYWVDEIDYHNVSAVIAWMTAELDRYQAAGLKGLIRVASMTQWGVPHGGPNYTGLQQVVTAIKDHPALYGYYAYDEPRLYPLDSGNGYSVPMVEDTYDTIKALDSAHPVYVVYPGYGASFWPDGTAYPIPTNGRKIYDVFGIDNYNIGGYQSAIAGCLSSVPVADRGKLFNVIGVAYSQTAANISTMAAATKTVGWDSSGDISFWLWHWPNGNALKETPSSQATVAAIAAQYHEDLYGGGTPPAPATTAVSRANMRANFR